MQYLGITECNKSSEYLHFLKMYDFPYQAEQNDSPSLILLNVTLKGWPKETALNTFVLRFMLLSPSTITFILIIKLDNQLDLIVLESVM